MTEAQNTPDPQIESSETDQAMKTKRKKLLSIFAVILIIIALVYSIYHIVFGQTVSTDNAYVGAETAEITSMVNGQVAEVKVSDTQQVKQGDVLAIVDPRDAQIALAQAQAELAKAKRQYTQSSANSSSLSSQIMISSDDINSAKAQVAQSQVAQQQAQQEFDRRNKLSASGAISKVEFT